MSKTRAEALNPGLLQSWGLETWPPSDWPHNRSKAKYVLRAYRDELIKAGAIGRVGRRFVVNGPQYRKWLVGRAAAVPIYTISNPNLGKRAADAPKAA
jgi:hypothetical protein